MIGRSGAAPPAVVEPGTIPLERPEPLVRVDDIAWVRFEKPDLDRATRFFSDFGLVPSLRTAEAVYLRGSGPAHHCVVLHRGRKSRFLGMGFRAASRDDLDRLACATGSGVVPREEPGGGVRVHLRDPDGVLVEVIHGVEELPPLETRTEPLPVNTPFRKARINRPQRPELAPAPVVRLGHCVLETPDFGGTARWYMRHLGLIPSDVQCLRDGTPILAFLRCDRGDRPADHHTLVVAGGRRAAYVHSAYEVVDLDAIGQGQQWLRARGREHVWGIGRHLLGSQIFDYWRDPWGHEVEHFTDGDVFDASRPTGYSLFERGSLWMWGQDLPASFKPKPSPHEIARIVYDGLRGRLDFATLRKLAEAVDRPPRSWLR